jgi:RNA polymerase sigma-70 factor (ECF subfamily)
MAYYNEGIIKILYFHFGLKRRCYIKVNRNLPYINSVLLTEESFVAFYRNHYASFCFFANRFINHPMIAEDIVGDVALKVWKKRGELRNETALKSYFYTSLRNTCLDWISAEKSKGRRKKRYLDSVQTEQSSFLENIIRTETLHELELAIQTLPLQCRRVVIKLFVEGKSLSEVAEEMQLSITTIKSQRQRGIKLLRNRLSITTFLIAAVLVFHLTSL